MAILALLLAFCASVIGGICGIGGGVIIKPVLDMIGFASVSVISFMSSCTVLSMSLYSVGRSISQKSRALEKGRSDVLAVSAALGGLLGNAIFQLIRSALRQDRLLGAAQALLLMVLVIGTLLYTLNKKKIVPRPVKSKSGCAVIGVLLGCASSFLGIGGGPFNLVVLHYFLGYESKQAVENSLYIILLSQIANLLLSLLTHAVPPFQPSALLLMIAGGVSGGIVGRAICRKLDNETVDKLFSILLLVIIALCVYNAAKYLHRI